MDYTRSEDLLLTRWRQERTAYAALGNFVKEAFEKQIETLGLTGKDLLRYPISPRVKAENSLVVKALYTKKYDYDRVTDKVGLRVVVLTEEDIERAEMLLKDISEIECRCSKDYREERIQHPTIHDYQGVHYEVHVRNALIFEGADIRPEYICEVQIRTILQHAVSEMSHDVTYKPDVQPPPEVYRALSSSMALAESASHWFSKASQSVKRQQEELEDFTKLLIAEYRNVDPSPLKLDYNFIATVLASYRDMIGKPRVREELRDFVKTNADLIRQSILRRRTHFVLYTQPVVILLFFLAHNAQRSTAKNWPYLFEQIEPVYNDLGVSPPEIHD